MIDPSPVCEASAFNVASGMVLSEIVERADGRDGFEGNGALHGRWVRNSLPEGRREKHS